MAESERGSQGSESPPLERKTCLWRYFTESAGTIFTLSSVIRFTGRSPG